MDQWLARDHEMEFFRPRGKGKSVCEREETREHNIYRETKVRPSRRGVGS